MLLEALEPLGSNGTVNNAMIVVGSMIYGEMDFHRTICTSVACGWDTDCNGATVGGLWGLTERPIPDSFVGPWKGSIGVTLAGHADLDLEDLVERTARVAERVDAEAAPEAG